LRTYEATFITDPNLSEEEVDNFIQQMSKVAESKGAQVVKVDRWGKKPLAFQVGRFREGIFVILTLEGGGEAISELERRFRVTDFIIRFLTVRIDPYHKRMEKIAGKRSVKQARRGASPTGVVPEAVREE
jgi:small subunit ribosomal protein S6